MFDKAVIKNIQELEIEVLNVIISVCTRCNLKVYMRGGSALGTVKYHGFVPWDDDIDIVLPRKDFLKLIEVMPEVFGDKFLFISHQKNKEAHCYIPRVILEAKYAESLGLPLNNERGLVMMDIFPLDGMPDYSFGLKIHELKSKVLRVLAAVSNQGIEDTFKWYTPAQQRMLRMLYRLHFHKLYTQDTIYKKMDRLYSKYQLGETKLAGMLMSSKGSMEVCPYEWWGEGKQMLFHGLPVLVPSDYDNYLKRLFGNDYAVYEPSSEKRTKSHLVRQKNV